MKILYIGDIMAKAGRRVVAQVLPDLKQELQIDFVIAQAENISHGKSPRPKDWEDMKAAGVDFFTGGNHSLTNPMSRELYEDTRLPIIRPANLVGTAGEGWKIVETPFGRVLVVSLLGQTVGMNQPEIANPLECIDEILEKTKKDKLAARIINFHGDFSSEKVVIGHYLDGKVTAVIGDHWHIPTADARLLLGGTAHITDVGMCGALDSSLGVRTQVIAERWKTGNASRNEMEEKGAMQFCAVLVDVDPSTSMPRKIVQIYKTF